jgi:hypothetical protein
LLSATPLKLLLPNPHPQPLGLRIFARQSPICQLSKKTVIKQQGNSRNTVQSYKVGLKKILCGLKKFSGGLNEKISGETLQRFAPKRCFVSPETLQRFAARFFR